MKIYKFVPVLTCVHDDIISTANMMFGPLSANLVRKADRIYFVNLEDNTVLEIVNVDIGRPGDLKPFDDVKAELNRFYGLGIFKDETHPRLVPVSDEVRKIFFQVDKMLNGNSSKNSEIICLDDEEYYINRKNGFVMKVEGAPNGK